jgi:ketosteroid isomerase-like protein
VQRIRLVLDRQEQAVQSGNLAAFDSLWSGAAGVLVFEQGSVDTTWAAYRDHHLGPELEALQELCYRHEGTEVRVGNTMAVATGRYHLTARYEGRPVESKGLFTTVFERQGDDWMIVHTHLSRRSENR